MPVTLNMIPATLQEFQTCPQMDLSKPENTCAMFLCALQLYMLRGPRPMTPYDSQFLRDRLRDKPYLPLAYFEGAAPKNNYTPAQPYVLNVLPDPRPQDIEAGYIRVFLKTAGADSPRPVKLRQKGSLWYLWEYSSILSGIRSLAECDPWG